MKRIFICWWEKGKKKFVVLPSIRLVVPRLSRVKHIACLWSLLFNWINRRFFDYFLSNIHWMVLINVNNNFGEINIKSQCMCQTVFSNIRGFSILSKYYLWKFKNSFATTTNWILCVSDWNNYIRALSAIARARAKED